MVKISWIAAAAIFFLGLALIIDKQQKLQDYKKKQQQRVVAAQDYAHTSLVNLKNNIEEDLLPPLRDLEAKLDKLQTDLQETMAQKEQLQNKAATAAAAVEDVKEKDMSLRVQKDEAVMQIEDTQERIKKLQRDIDSLEKMIALVRGTDL